LGGVRDLPSSAVGPVWVNLRREAIVQARLLVLPRRDTRAFSRFGLMPGARGGAGEAHRVRA